MSKLIVEYYLIESEIPSFILEGGSYCIERDEYGKTYVGITNNDTVESDLPTGVNVLTRNQFLSRSLSIYDTADPTDFSGTDGEPDGPTPLTDSEKITIATELSSSWVEL